MEDWVLYALMSALSAALATILAKFGLSGVDSMVATALRSIIMTLMAFLVLGVFRGFSGISTVSTRDVIFIILSGIAGGASWIFYFMALQKGEASKVALIDRSSILFVIVFSILLLGEKLTPQKFVAATLITVALYLLLL